MHQPHHRAFRVLLIVWTVAVAFGLGAERSRAATALPSCQQICIDSCAPPRDGCDDYFAEGGTCYYWCLDGSSGEVQMGR
jgi:hypothetical protein